MKSIRPQVAPRPTRAAAIALEDCRFFLAHEMRTPLVALEMAVARGGLPAVAPVDPARFAQMQAAIATLRSQGEALTGLIDLATRPLVLETVDLTSIFRQASERLARSCADRVVQVDVEPGLRCTADTKAVIRLAGCLLDNAWKFTGATPGAAVRVGRSSGTGGERMPCFHVADNGAGFDPESADELFQAFRRLHSVKRFPGLGTGLALVRIAVERHGGRVQAQGSPGVGCRIEFSLPAARG